MEGCGTLRKRLPCMSSNSSSGYLSGILDGMWKTLHVGGFVVEGEREGGMAAGEPFAVGPEWSQASMLMMRTRGDYNIVNT